MRYVKTTSFSFLINRVSTGHVIPSRGLRQGDPISPYLYLLCSEGLSGLMRRATEVGAIHGYRVCHEAPPISHLLFVDDTIIFCGAEADQAEYVKEILKSYERASGQAINLAKMSMLFRRGVVIFRKRTVYRCNAHGCRSPRMVVKFGYQKF